MKNLFQRVISFATSINGACAIYKNPEGRSVNLLISKTAECLKSSAALSKEGFLVAPYTKGKSSIFIEKDLFIEYDLDKKDFVIDGNVTLKQSFLDFSTEKTTSYSSFNADETTSKNEFVAQVDKALNALENRELHKVVLSKIKKIEKPTSFDLVNVYCQLIEVFPKLFISLVNSSETGVWLGATPEILVHQNKNWFNTVALAGTQKGDGLEPRDAVWRQKEIEEQAYVSRYIINCFKKIRLREFDERGPKTIKAGQLLHLKTEFWVELDQVPNNNLLQEMLTLLHPTSAVCGMPLDIAESYVDETENHDRRFYAGYLGPVNMNDETTLYVNLRCCEVLQDEIVFYAGAGITEDSDPEKEWVETEIKCDTLLQFIQ